MDVSACVVRAALAVALAIAVALAAASTRSATAWDGCTPKEGDLTMRAADGTRLAAHRFGHGRIAVVLAHQSDGTVCQWIPYARRLAGLGYLVVAFDFRSHGDSQVRHYPANQRLGGDVAAAVKTARGLGATKVFLVGASIGGSAVLDAAANVRPPVAGVVSVSGAADLVNAIEAVKHLSVPALYLAAKGDVDFAADAKRLYDATPSADRSLTILPRYEHGVQLIAASKQARALVERFLRSH